MALDHPAATRTCLPRATIASTLRSLTLKTRRLVGDRYAASGGTRGHLNGKRRALLAAAILHIQFDLEREQPGHPTVRTLRMIRHRLSADPEVVHAA